MNILMNLFPVQLGGGQQVATNFIKIIADTNFDHKWFFFVGRNSELHEIVKTRFPSDNILAIPYSYKARLINGKVLNRFVESNNIDVVFNYAPILNLRKKLPQVVRSVYSNLYFPEINFWVNYSFLTRIKKKLIDKVRLRRTLAADGLVFENKSMQDRAIKLFNYPSEKTVYIKPSISQFDEVSFNPVFDSLKDEDEFKILYLSSWHLNKNIQILPKVAEELKKNNIDIKFVLSLSSDSPQIQDQLIEPIKRKGVEKYFIFIGKVPANYVHQVVRSCNAMILLSKLECFSSNIIEAFHFRKPLIISDELWSKNECLDAALYVKRDDVQDISVKIAKLSSNIEFYEQLVNKGSAMLKEFNSPVEKVKKQIQFLEQTHRDFYK